MRALLLGLVLAASCSGPAADPVVPPPTPPRADPEPPRDVPAQVEEEPCPVLADRRPIGGSGPSLAPVGVVEDLEGIAASIPPTIGSWSRAELRAVPRGTAGTASSQVSATFVRERSEIGVRIVDLVHVCLCRPGDGRRLRDRAVRGDPRQGGARDVRGAPGLVARAEAGTYVNAWVADRCQVTVEGRVPEAALIEIVEGLDLARLATACRAP